MEEPRTDCDSDVQQRIEAAHYEFGGLDGSAMAGGFLAGVGALAVIGTIGLPLLAFFDTVPIPSGIIQTMAFFGLLIALFAAFAVAGFVSGRIARYDSTLNSSASTYSLLMVLIVVGLLERMFGGDDDVFSKAVGTGRLVAVIALLLAVAAGLGAGWVGGKLGERYQQKVDSLIAEPTSARRPAWWRAGRTAT